MDLISLLSILSPPFLRHTVYTDMQKNHYPIMKSSQHKVIVIAKKVSEIEANFTTNQDDQIVTD